MSPQALGVEPAGRFDHSLVIIAVAQIRRRFAIE
jgi:hypothetical protein